MKKKDTIKTIVSAIVGLIIDQSFSITSTIREFLDPYMVGIFFSLAKPLIILGFFLVEIMAVYQFLDKLKLFEKILE